MPEPNNSNEEVRTKEKVQQAHDKGKAASLAAKKTAKQASVKAKEASRKAREWSAKTMSLENDSRQKTIFVAVVLCLVCSIVVAGAAIALRPIQLENQALDRKRNILQVAGLMEDEGNVDELFEQIETRILDMETGQFTDAVDPATYDFRKAAKDPTMSARLTKEEDIAGIKSQADYMPVFLVKNGEAIQTVILPVSGYGLWSTLYGFLAVDSDANTIKSLKFYEHAETPGLGGEVDNQRWRAFWTDKKIYREDDYTDPVIEVAKGSVEPNDPNLQYKVDGLAGATLTSRGVTNMMEFWLGEQGYAPFLARLREGEI